ncbi:MAG: hypothetical protein ABIR54_21235 [Burkholderiaceae bacterium]
MAAEDAKFIKVSFGGFVDSRNMTTSAVTLKGLRLAGSDGFQIPQLIATPQVFR